jgi:hypothetical protein
VIAQFLISQRFKVEALALLAVLVMGLRPAAAQGDKPSLPDPVKFINKFDIVWNVSRAMLDDMGYATELEDKKGGRIVTKPYEFITGSLTATEMDKVAIKRDSITGSWLKARYTAEVLLEIVAPTQTLVTVRTKMEGLNREVDGSEKWVPIESRGVVEKRILGRISMKLMGQEMNLEGKKGFWDKSPQPVDSRKPNPVRPPN